jgi:hypothetical protein
VTPLFATGAMLLVAAIWVLLVVQIRERLTAGSRMKLLLYIAACLVFSLGIALAARWIP